MDETATAAPAREDPLVPGAMRNAKSEMQNGKQDLRRTLVYKELAWNRIAKRLVQKDGDAEIQEGTKLCKIIGKPIGTAKARQLR